MVIPNVFSVPYALYELEINFPTAEAEAVGAIGLWDSQ